MQLYLSHRKQQHENILILITNNHHHLKRHLLSVHVTSIIYSYAHAVAYMNFESNNILVLYYNTYNINNYTRTLTTDYTINKINNILCYVVYINLICHSHYMQHCA